MIRELHLLDLGVIEDATIELGDSLTVITGETGAGKTMLLTGLGLLLGGRADPATVRPGARQAAVEGRLVPEGEALRIAEDAGAMLDDGELVVVRTVAAEGRSRAHLGGRSVPVGLLAQIGAEMVTVHGQSDQVRLRAAAEQRAALDGFAGSAHQQALRDLAAAHERRRRLSAELERWDADAAERDAELERLRQALERIDTLEPVPGELARLREESERLTNVESLLEAVATARAALDGDEQDGGGAVAALQAARHALDVAAAHDPQLQEWSERLGDAVHVANDIVAEAGSYATGLEADPARLDALHARRAALTDLLRTYATDLPATADDDPLVPLLELARDARARVAELTAPGAGREGLEERLAQAASEVRTTAAVVSQNRRTAAAELSEQVDAELEGLSMRGAHLHVALLPRPEIGPTGAEDVELQLQSHPDAPPRPIAKGASGGELSRIMLALEVALAGRRARTQDRLPVFVFDEVDAGVGGRAATEVGRRLAELARHTQVVVVTHLAQVAAFADTHLVVTKTDGDGGGVATTIHPVVGEGREHELARMLSGEQTDLARQHAAELLSRPERADMRR